MKIAHISLHIEFYAGIHRQRLDEAEAARQLDGTDWQVFVASPNRKYLSDKIHYIPLFPYLSRLFESHNKLIFYLTRILTINFLLLRIAFNLQVNKLSKAYDYVIVRYNSADLCAFTFLKRKHKLLFYHHCKPTEELRGYSYIAYLVEKITGKAHHKGIKAIIGVSPEIAEFECRRNSIKKSLTLSNGILVSKNAIEDARDPSIVKIIMVCSSYQSYNGYDLLLQSIKQYTQPPAFSVHFYGNAYSDQIAQINDTPHCVYKGFIQSEKLPEIFASFDIGIGALAFYRNGLDYACTLKVREYLANGLPAVIGHTDIAFTEDFPFIKQLDRDFTFDKILDYAFEMKSIDKNTIKREATPYINQKDIMYKFIQELESI